MSPAMQELTNCMEFARKAMKLLACGNIKSLVIFAGCLRDAVVIK